MTFRTLKILRHLTVEKRTPYGILAPESTSCLLRKCITGLMVQRDQELSAATPWGKVFKSYLLTSRVPLPNSIFNSTRD